MSTLADYKDRTVDVAAFTGWELGAERQVTQALALPGYSGSIIAGIEKLVQRFTIELFTELGSLLYLPARGCSFMIDARSGIWRTVGDVEESFSSALLTVATNLGLEETDDDPDDEVFSSAEVVAVSLLGDSVTLRLKIISAADTSFTVLLPLTVTPY
jgi:hypothetical protein